jgi:preprotein translocase subunit SecG
MTTFLTILHVLVCLALIGIVLLQHGKGADIGATFGGSSQTLFGSTGATTFLGKLTAAAAVLFMVTSLGLGILSRAEGPDQGYTDVPAPTAPAVPEQPLAPPPAAPAAPAQ